MSAVFHRWKRLFCLLLITAVPGAGCGPSLDSTMRTLSEESDQIHLPEFTPETWGVPWSYEHVIRADVLEARGDLPGAVRAMSLAVEGDPVDHLLRVKLALLLISSGDLDRASKQLSRALLLEPASIQAWLAVADLYVRRGRNDQAILAAQTGAQMNPDLAAPLFWIGEFQLKKGNDTTALQFFAQGLKSEPDNVRAHQASFEILERSGRSAEAGVHLDALLTSRDVTPEVVFSAVNRQIASGDIAGAVARLERFLAMSPLQDTVRAHLIEILLANGLFDRACAHIANLDIDGREESSFLRRAGLYEQAGSLWRAREELVTGFGEAPASPEARLMLARVEWKLGHDWIALLLISSAESSWPESLGAQVEALRTEITANQRL